MLDTITHLNNLGLVNFCKLGLGLASRPTLGGQHLSAGWKVKGFSYEDLLTQWGEEHLPSGTYLIVTDLNLSGKPKEFWAEVPRETRRELTSDIVTMRCSSISQAKGIVDSLERTGVGEAIIIHDNSREQY